MSVNAIQEVPKKKKVEVTNGLKEEAIMGQLEHRFVAIILIILLLR